jgi:hypothetical protein
MLPALAEVLRKARVRIAVLPLPSAHAGPRDGSAHAPVDAEADGAAVGTGAPRLVFEPISVLGCDALVRSVTLRFMHFGDADPAPVHAVRVDAVAPSSDGARAVRTRAPSHGAHLPGRPIVQGKAPIVHVAPSCVAPSETLAPSETVAPRQSERRSTREPPPRCFELEYESDLSGSDEADAVPVITKSGRTVKPKLPKGVVFERGNPQAAMAHCCAALERRWHGTGLHEANELFRLQACSLV